MLQVGKGLIKIRKDVFLLEDQECEVGWVGKIYDSTSLLERPTAKLSCQRCVFPVSRMTTFD